MARPKSKTKKILFAVEIIVLLLFIGGLYVYGQLNSKLDKINQPVLDDSKIKVNQEVQDSIDSQESTLTGYTTYALFGIDHRDKNTALGGENSDTIIIASVNNDTKDVKLVSVYRDTLLNLGNDTYSKANAAYAYGEAEQAITMLNTNLDLNISEYATVNFNALTTIIDDLGGLDMDMSYAEIVHMNNYCVETSEETGKDYTPIELPDRPDDIEAVQYHYHLNGVQATSYCRIRYTASLDMGRTERQRRVIQMIVSKAKSAGLGKIFKIMDDVFPMVTTSMMTAGMVGYITASIKNLGDTRVGDTVTDNERPCAEALPGYKKVQPMVYCGLYPADGARYGDLRDALEKLQLNDASLFFEPETSIALGFGFRCGFLGLLHLEIIQERLEREYNLDLVTTAPGVVYKVYKTNGEVIELTNPSNLPDPSEIEYMEEPMVNAEIMVTTEFIGAIMDLCQERRGQYNGMEYMEETRALLKYKLPLNEIIYDFFDALKSRSRGYASLDYELCGYERSELVKLDILVNKEEVDALSFIVHADTAYERGRKMCEKLKEEIPRQLFEIPIQAAIGSKIIARETVRAMRKDVLAKCYGGDISRKKKLLEKQKEGKKRMRQVGNVEIPQKAFMSVLKLDDK